MLRRITTLIFAAIPASLLFPLIVIMLGNSYENLMSGYVLDGTLAGIIGIMAACGIVGLFLVSFQKKYETRLNLFFIGCGTLVASFFYIAGFFSNPTWYFPTTLGKDTFELLFSTSVLGFGIYYCFSIAKKIFRDFGNDP